MKRFSGLSYALLLLSLALVAVHTAADVSVKDSTQATSTSTTPTTATTADNVTRSARMVKYLTDPKAIAARRTAQPHIRKRADFGGAALPLGPAPKRLPNAYAQPQRAPGFPPRHQVLRRVHNNNAPPPPPPPRFSYEPLKSSYYSPLKLGPAQYNNGGGAGSAYGKGHGAPGAQRPQYSNPNALTHSHAPGAPSQQQQQHFKASPPFNGQAIVRPATEQQSADAYPKQYALPQHQHHQPQHQQQPQVFPNSIATYQQPPVAPQQQQQLQFAYQQQQQHQQQQGTAPGGNGPKMYSVYEEPEHVEQATLQLNAQQQYGAAALTSADMLAARQAQDYIKFMNSNGYFLPKRDPNYKQLDAEKDRQQYYQQQQQQQQQQHQHPQPHQNQQQHLRFGHAPSGIPAPAAGFNQQPIQVASLHYPHGVENAAATAASTAAVQRAPDTAAIVRGSYQTGNNMFVVNSDGNKAVHHIVASPLPTQHLLETTTPTAVTSQRGELRYSAAHRRTPEPVRFEFTENDAMPSAVTAYTSTPHTHLRYSGNGNGNGNNNMHKTVVSSTTRTPSVISSSLAASKPSATKNTIYASRKSATESSVLGSGTGTGTGSGTVGANDDVEDGDDMHEENYPRKLPKLKTKKVYTSSSSTSTSTSSSSSSTTSTTPAPADTKDTEEYCERMCAIVHDDNAEIVCGSDGYMYTSEAQMECYASCLHIDVTIQSKGSCSER